MYFSKKKLFYYFLYLVAFLFLFHLGNFTAGDRQNYYDIFSGQFHNRDWGFWLISYLFTNFSPSATLSLFIFSTISFTFAFCSITGRITHDDQKYFAFGIIYVGALSLYSIGLLRAGLANWMAVYLYLHYLKTNKKMYIALLPLVATLHVQLAPFVVIVFSHHIMRISPKILTLLTTLSTCLLIFFPELIVNLLNLPISYNSYFNDPSKRNYLFFSPSIWSYFIISISTYLITRKNQDKGLTLSYIGLPFAIIPLITGHDLITRFMGPFLFLSWIYFFEYSWPRLKSWLTPHVSLGFNSLLVIISFLYAYLRHSI